MTVSSVFCETCKRDRPFFAIAGGLGIQCVYCNTIHHNRAESYRPLPYDTSIKRRAAKRRGER